jgi:DNA-binding NarL/FixJ family response regulator
MVAERVFGVLIVDDDEAVSETLQRAFRITPKLLCLGWVPTADLAEPAILRLKPDVVLLDVEMSGMDPMVATAMLGARYPGVRFAMLSIHCVAEVISRALAAGATGFICKDEPLDVLAAACLRVAEGQVFLSPRASEALRGG